MDKTIFEVEISNSGPKSYETATVMKMPASFAEFSDALQKARIKDGSFCKNELTCMGCWGITALESDNGLDAVRCVRYNLPADGQLDLGEMLERLKKDRWNAPCDVKLGCAHTSPMALAEIVVKYLDGDPGSLDYDEEWAAEDNKFRSITSFTASRASLRELRDYLADTLKYARIRAERQIKAGELPGGWFDPKDWDGWQKHMEGLIHRLDGVLALEGSTLELAHPPAPTVPELTM